MAVAIEVKYFNTFLLKKVLSDEESNYEPMYGGSFGIPEQIGGYPSPNLLNNLIDSDREWVIEESRIEGGFNNTTVDFGPKAYVVDEDNGASIRSNSLIYSGIYNSRTGINNTNQFSVGEDITKSLDPANGSIQKLYAEDTNLIILQENKVSRALIDKDAIYSAEGGGTLTTSFAVIGDIIPYAGNYGISQDPTSFAVYGYRKYFTDKFRNAILRLSQDGITEISEYGMSDFFRDTFNSIDSRQYGQGNIVGGWDAYNKQYLVSLQTSRSNPSQQYYTVNFDDSVNGFTSFFSFKPSHIFSIRNNTYTVNSGSLWIHYSQNEDVGSFYGTRVGSSITFVLNDNTYLSKNFKTINYEGDNGWQVDSFISDAQKFDLSNALWVSNSDTIAQIPSYIGGIYTDSGVTYHYGFDRKENKYYANLVNNSSPTDGEVIYGSQMSGIKGRFATVTMSTDNVTDVGGFKELWSVGSEYVMSSY